jgi:hypothetical protein
MIAITIALFIIVVVQFWNINKMIEKRCELELLLRSKITKNETKKTKTNAVRKSKHKNNKRTQFID